MKSTTSDAIDSRASLAAGLRRPDRWKALPFAILMLSSGLPLNYKLEPARPMYVTDIAELTMSSTLSGSATSSIPFTLFLGGLYALAGWMLMKQPRSAALILIRQWPLTLLLLFIAASALWSYHPEKVLFNIVHSFGTTFVAIAAALRYRHDPWLFPKHLGYILGINMLLHFAAIFLIPSYAIDWQNRWHGLAMHPNTLGSLAFATLWANASAMIFMKPDRHHFHFIFCVLAIVAMIGADSVTSIITSMIAIGSIYMMKALERRRAGMHAYVSMFVLASLLCLLVVMVGTSIDLSWLFGLFGRDSNLTGRTSIWEDAIKAISKYPVLGWSFDDHLHLIQTQGMVYGSYHNGLLDLAVSGGVIAIVLLFLLFAVWAIGFTKPMRISRRIAPLSVSFVIAYLFHNFSEASLVAARDPKWLIFLVLICLGVCRSLPAMKKDQSRDVKLAAPPLQIDSIGSSG